MPYAFSGNTWPLLQLFYLDTEAEVLAIRARAKALILDGKTIMKVAGGGRESEKQFPLPPAQVLFEANAALRHINPTVYGRRVRKTYTRVSRDW